MKYLNSILCVWVLLVSIVVNITPKAYELLSMGNKTGEAWISRTAYFCPTGDTYIIVKGGAPETTGSYDVVEVKDLKLYVPINRKAPVINIVDFVMKNGLTEVGILLPTPR